MNVFTKNTDSLNKISRYMNAIFSGCGSVAVSIEACGASGPGSIPGRGPLNLREKGEKYD